MFTKLLKSKTINFAVWVPILATIINTLGVEVPPEVWTGVIAIGMFVLRLFTKVAIADK